VRRYTFFRIRLKKPHSGNRYYGPMRRFFVIAVLVSALLAPVAARAAQGADGTVTLKNATGVFVVSGKGTIVGQIDKGRVRIEDPVPNDGGPAIVSGAEHARPLSDTKWLYSGNDVAFRMIGGTFAIRVEGQGVDLAFVGRGTITVTEKSFDSGQYSLDGGDTFKPVPTLQTTFLVGS
jgi:hypothetical protein